LYYRFAKLLKAEKIAGLLSMKTATTVLIVGIETAGITRLLLQPEDNHSFI
jgi:hypothetical protein